MEISNLVKIMFVLGIVLGVLTKWGQGMEMLKAAMIGGVGLGLAAVIYEAQEKKEAQQKEENNKV